MTPDDRQIREVHCAWIAAVNAGDLARLLALMTDDVVFLTPDQAPFGRDAFARNFTDAHRELHIDCASELEEVTVVGPVAYARSRDALSVARRAGGGATRLTGHRLTVYRKEPDGAWRLARDAHTLSPAQEPHP